MTNATPLSKKLVAGALMLAVAGASLGYATEAEARRGGGKGMNVSFEEIDKNGDGFVTQAEVDAHRLARFAAMDTNGDGALSVEELVAAAKEVELDVPLVVRLEGTNVAKGKQILADSGLPIVSADDLGDAARKIVEQVQK